MKIRFDRNISRVHDAIQGLTHCYKDNYKRLYEEYNLDLNKASEKAFHFISERMKFDSPYNDLFFSKETEIAITFTRSRFIPSNLAVDNFVDYLRGLSDEEIKLIVLSGLKPNGVNLSQEELRLISQDETKVLNFIRELQIPSSIKWETAEFFLDVKSAMEGFIKLIKRYIPICKMVLKKNEKLVEGFEKYISDGIESEGEAFLTKLSKGSIGLDANEVIVGTLFFSTRSLICVIIDEKLYVFVGMDYEETLKMVTGDGEIDININVFKNLSDKTRFQILNLLKHGELYGQEIADKVGITMATVSYHMNYLLASNLVRLEKVGQKGYYTLNEDTLRKSIDFLKSNFNL